MLYFAPRDPPAPESETGGPKVAAHQRYDLFFGEACCGVNGIKAGFVTPSQLDDFACYGVNFCPTARHLCNDLLKGVA